MSGRTLDEPSTEISTGPNSPDVRRHASQKQAEQKVQHDRHVKERNFNPGEAVCVENHSKLTNDKWIPAVVINRSGPVSYIVETPDGQALRRHVDQVLTKAVPKPPTHTDEQPTSHNEEQSGEMPAVKPGERETKDELAAGTRYPRRSHQSPSYLEDEAT